MGGGRFVGVLRRPIRVPVAEAVMPVAPAKKTAGVTSWERTVASRREMPDK